MQPQFLLSDILWKYVNISIIDWYIINEEVIICMWRIKEWELQIWSWSSPVQPENATLFTISFQCLDKIFFFQKLAGLWLASEVVNHIGIYGSKVAEGLSVFQRRSCYCLLVHEESLTIDMQSSPYRSNSKQLGPGRMLLPQWKLLFKLLNLQASYWVNEIRNPLRKLHTPFIEANQENRPWLKMLSRPSTTLR